MNLMLKNIKSRIDGVWLNGKHSYYDYGMVFDFPDMGVPEPREYIVDVPGANGSVDMTSAVDGYVKYKDRHYSLTFYAPVTSKDREALKSRLLEDFHGKQIKIELDEDAGWVYEGRAKISFATESKTKLKIIFEGDCSPYKLKTEDTDIQFDLSRTEFDVEDSASAEETKSVFNIPENLQDVSDSYSLWVYLVEATTSCSVSIATADDNVLMYGMNDPYGSKLFEVRLHADNDITTIKKITVNKKTEKIGTRKSDFGFEVVNSKMEVVPEFSLANLSSVYVTVNGVRAQITDTHLKDENLLLRDGTNTVFFETDSTGEQSVNMTFREGRL